jgi:hypothetical protein
MFADIAAMQERLRIAVRAGTVRIGIAAVGHGWLSWLK